MTNTAQEQPSGKSPVTVDDVIRAASQSGTVPAVAAVPANTTAPNAAIICDNLVKIYKVAELEVFALQGLDLVINQGELLGIVGASGSGKTTLMNILGGLDRPSAGRIWVDGLDLLNLSDSALDRYRRTMVGFVWQQGGRNLIPYLNALENVELPMTLAGYSAKQKRARANELLEAVGLESRRNHRLQEMSGGEQQRVAIAVALANAPHLLLADEPTGELDSTTALSIYRTMQDLNKRYGITIVIVSHDPTIARHVNRVVAVRDGKLATETVRQIRTTTTNGENGENGDTLEDAVAGVAAEEHHEEILQELIVLDSAGRLQIPKEYLQKMNIKTRVTLEVTEDGILIRPAAGDDGHGPSAEALGRALAANKRSGSGRPLHSRLLDRMRGVVNPRGKGEG
jgi:putative ABC transport system ATP-binding protein